MSERSNAKDIALGVAAFAVIIGGAVWFDMSRQEEPAAAPVVEAAAATPETPVPDAVEEVASDTAPTPDTAPDTSSDVASETPADTTPETPLDTVTAEAEPEPEAPAPNVASDPIAAAPMAPAIDTFFRNPDETTIIAGRATAGQVVAIMLAGDELDRVEAAADGTFGAVVFIAAADQPRRLRLIGDPDGEAIVSAESVIVPPSAPVAVATTAPAADAPQAVASVSQDTAPASVDDSTDPVIVSADVTDAQAPEVDADSPEAPALIAGGGVVATAPPTLIADADGVRVIQRPDPNATKPAFLDNIALDTITYDTKGEVILAGRAASEGFVQVYLDNQPITTSRISDGGDWQIDLPDVDTGVYTLRVDEVDDAGNVTSRIETPFKREEPETVAAIMAEDTSAEGFDVAVRTVQPGATLWAIAEEQFGAGIKYVSVFEANRDQIRNPDLIYPGQVFRIPEVAE